MMILIPIEANNSRYTKYAPFSFRDHNGNLYYVTFSSCNENESPEGSLQVPPGEDRQESNTGF